MTIETRKPRFLTVDQVSILHQLGLMEFGGLAGVRDPSVLDLTFDELKDRLVAITDSWRSGGSAELTAVVNDASLAIPVLGALALLCQNDRGSNEQAIHYIQLLCALHRIAEEKGYDW